ncbi:iron-sulfur cluster assembly protein [Volvox carteri f. nagariensis]|uniref:Iron-sulfur cluster assembly protein n=1 Tax=Volvox carteri f. nagariensis TaxID=3068 RepID=D8TS54_VOLCA|nr:iron-sulfur cluster assembly protein [Volvox carteri f. nagariensis]EFJ49765.1 iron-sulfur cluster assembly protein [Volvox carteri f. nagariensis]|eukprot:XP_002949272.1 iron-sulfur cluster assembly protein [Volvox carteri f. nagariensis]
MLLQAHTVRVSAGPKQLRLTIPAVRARVIRVEAAAGGTVTTPASAITLTAEALEQLRKLRAEHKNQESLLLRVGVKQGGCSGLSYHMDFETQDKVSEDDHVMSYDDGFRLVVDPKSLLYLFGMRLGYSSALIGGGFQFHNPNATDSCGCGKSFGV